MKSMQKLTLIIALSAMLTSNVSCSKEVDSNVASAFDDGSQLQLLPAFPQLPGMGRPLGLYQPPRDDGRFFVILQQGVVLSFENDSMVKQTTRALDISSRVESGPNEAGLLGLAFHPEFNQPDSIHQHQLFLSYTTRRNRQLTSVISSFKIVASQPSIIDASSEQIILEVEQPAGNHNGGQIAFGPDGYLYIGFGDGGGAGDTYGNAQNINTLLGAMLRIDVSHGAPYRIPSDNPFVDKLGRDEIYAWGLRNPWRWSFDRETGQLLAADVGQDDWEEINLIEINKNYGWNIMEGTHCYEPEDDCPQSGLSLPIHEYGHGEGRSVTGGFVYRGQTIPSLQGTYIYTDFYPGPIWGLTLDGNGPYRHRVLIDNKAYVPAFAEDNAGELYVLQFSGETGKNIYRIIARE